MKEKSVGLICSDGLFNFNGKKFNFFPSVGLKVTGACNNSCPFCCEPNRKQSVYAIDNFIRITKILRQLGTMRLCFTGGEPLLYPNIDRLMKHTKTLGFYNLLLTGDGALLMKKYNELLPSIDAIRFSIHAVGTQHDEIVGQPGAFYEMEKALDALTKEKVPCFVTTVVTRLNLGLISEIASWCFNKKVQTFFLFGLMRSGKGWAFIDKHGEVLEAELYEITAELERKYSPDQLKIIVYEYNKNAECILIYGDGRVVIDPYPVLPSFQLEIGNIISNTPSEILDRFNKDPENYSGHYDHLKKWNKDLT